MLEMFCILVWVLFTWCVQCVKIYHCTLLYKLINVYYTSMRVFCFLKHLVQLWFYRLRPQELKAFLPLLPDAAEVSWEPHAGSGALTCLANIGLVMLLALGKAVNVWQCLSPWGLWRIMVCLRASCCVKWSFWFYSTHCCVWEYPSTGLTHPVDKTSSEGLQLRKSPVLCHSSLPLTHDFLSLNLLLIAS